MGSSSGFCVRGSHVRENVLANRSIRYPMSAHVNGNLLQHVLTDVASRGALRAGRSFADFHFADVRPGFAEEFVYVGEPREGVAHAGIAEGRHPRGAEDAAHGLLVPPGVGGDHGDRYVLGH